MEPKFHKVKLFPHCLPDLPSVQFRPVTIGIAIMLGKSCGKVVPSGKIFLRTHIKVVMLHVVQDGIQPLIVGIRSGPGGSPACL